MGCMRQLIVLIHVTDVLLSEGLGKQQVGSLVQDLNVMLNLKRQLLFLQVDSIKIV